MCGIVGCLEFHAPVDPSTLLAMRDALAHRGPDDAGAWFSNSADPAIGLGHRRLAIVDLSPLGRQPMTSGDGRLVLVYNGEVYNYRELAVELGRRGHRFRGESDSEVVLAAFAEWGPRCVERFNGMWALAVWDERERRLFVSRDRLGKKPLFYYFNGQRFAFASEAKALFRHPRIACRVDAEALDAFCRTHALERGRRTLFAHVRRLPPAHNLSIGADARLAIEPYWRLDPANRATLGSTAAYVSRFAELFEDSVRLRLRADVPVGSSLSGGLDSSLIVGTIARLRAREPASAAQHTFSARFPDMPEFDEGRFIDAMVARTDATPHAISPDGAGLLAAIERLHYHQEEPFQSSSIFAQWEVMRLARENAMPVLLDGQGADETLAGYVPYVAVRLLDLITRGQLRAARNEYRAFARRQESARRATPGLDARTFALSPAALLRGALASIVRRLRSPAEVNAAEPMPRGPSRLWTRLHRDTARDNLPLLLRYADRNAMAFAIEVRNPFLDYRLVEYAMALPDEMKIRDGWTKYVLRAAGDVLPDEIRWRPDKVGYVTPEDRWLAGPLRDWAAGALGGERLRSLPGYPAERVLAAWRRLDERHGRPSPRGRRAALWPWLSLNAWLGMVERSSFAAPAIARAA